MAWPKKKKGYQKKWLLGYSSKVTWLRFRGRTIYAKKNSMLVLFKKIIWHVWWNNNIMSYIHQIKVSISLNHFMNSPIKLNSWFINNLNLNHIPVHLKIYKSKCNIKKNGSYNKLLNLLFCNCLILFCIMSVKKKLFLHCYVEN